MHPIFENEDFKHIEEYVNNIWRPSTECAVIVTKTAIVYPLLEKWFNEHKDETISIGPYVDICPYGIPFELETKSSSGESMIEFLFLYDSIDSSKLTRIQLSLGRDDFVDINASSRPIY